jgi:isoleucyl-tRNA synthetase
VGSYAELLSKPGVSGTEVWEEAKRKNPALADDLKIHKPYIDAITYDSPFAAGARMRRVSEVIDCWFDSGAMPFAQWGYPHLPDSAVRLADQFPADFISEALDQTRGWFYSLLAISTLLFGEGSGDGGRGGGDGGKSNLPSSASGRGVGGEGSPPGSQSALTLALSQGERGQNLKSPNLQISKSPNPLIPNPQSLIPRPFPHPFRTCIVLGLMLGEDGGKMSKSKRNYRDPEEIFSLYGADALRWYFFANQPPWTSIRYSEQAIKDCIPEFLLRLWNVYSFFVIYANIDGFDPADALCGAGVPPAQLDSDVLARAKGYRPIAQRGELDRWILGELNSTAAAVVERMDAYDNFAACGRLTDFVDALSNWYVRRSRDRFWSGEKLAESADKLDAYWTLYECLLTTCKLIAPFVPFLAEAMWQNLAVAAFSNTKDHKKPLESVHLCDYPSGDATAVDPQLSAQMSLMREITSLGRSARMAAKLKVRQPLAQVEVVLADETHRGWLEQHAALIREELNVKRVEFITEAKKYVTYLIQPDLKRLGPRLGKRLPAVRKLLTEADGARLCEQLKSRGSISLRLEDGPIELSGEDVQIRLQARAGWAAAEGRAVVVVLSTELTEELILEGLARELVRAIQDRRKELDCQFTDRIAVGIETDAAELRAAVEHFGDYISGETLAVELKLGPLPGVEPVELDIAGHKARLNVKPM